PTGAVHATPGGVVMRLSSVVISDMEGVVRVADANLQVRQREIVGLAALENSGHQLLLRVIAGRVMPAAGTVERRGEPALIPEDRHRDALILGFSLTENVALKGAARRRGRINWPGRRSSCTRAISTRCSPWQRASSPFTPGV